MFFREILNVLNVSELHSILVKTRKIIMSILLHLHYVCGIKMMFRAPHQRPRQIEKYL